jgi:RNA recognition motif-containing protein
MNIYIGNLSYNVSEDELGKAFRSFGQVETVKIIRDKYSPNQKDLASLRCPLQKKLDQRSLI